MATITTIKRLSVFLLLLSSLVSSEVFLAGEIPRSLTPRDAVYGGWALSTPVCPAGTQSCKSDDNAPSCCPNEYECKYEAVGTQHFCCTPGTNCQTMIRNIPACANTSWSLFQLSSGYSPWCCLPGQVGVSTGYGYGSCGDAGRVYPSSLLASTIAAPSVLASSTSPLTPLASSIANTHPTSANIPSNPANPSNTANSQPSPTQSSSTNPSFRPSQTSSSSTNITTGAFIGIAVAGVAVIAILGLVGCICFRYGQRRRNPNPHIEAPAPASTHGLGPPAPPVVKQPYVAYPLMSEIGEYTRPVNVAPPAPPQRSEVENHPAPRVELDGSARDM